MLNNNDLSTLKNSLPFWEKLTKTQQALLAENTNAAHFPQGQSLYNGETQCIGVLVVKNGSIRIYITSEEGREVTLYRLESGDICILSASCVLQSIDFDVSVDAETDCDILQVSSIAFSKLMSENVYAELFSYKMATERFSDVMWAMQQMLFTSLDKRLAAFLLDECTKNKRDDIRMTHEQLAKYLGSAREVVSRMLNYFAKEGYVTLSRGTITVVDKARLREIL